MNAHLNHILAQQRIGALQRAADHARQGRRGKIASPSSSPATGMS